MLQSWHVQYNITKFAFLKFAWNQLWNFLLFFKRSRINMYGGGRIGGTIRVTMPNIQWHFESNILAAYSQRVNVGPVLYVPCTQPTSQGPHSHTFTHSNIHTHYGDSWRWPSSRFEIKLEPISTITVIFAFTFVTTARILSTIAYTYNIQYVHVRTHITYVKVPLLYSRPVEAKDIFIYKKLFSRFYYVMPRFGKHRKDRKMTMKLWPMSNMSEKGKCVR